MKLQELGNKAHIVWIRGHDGNAGNEEANAAANWARLNLPASSWPVTSHRTPDLLLHDGIRPISAAWQLRKPPGPPPVGRLDSRAAPTRCWKWMWGVVNAPPGRGYSYHRDQTRKLCVRCHRWHDCTVTGSAAECSWPKWVEFRAAVVAALPPLAREAVTSSATDSDLARLLLPPKAQEALRLEGLDCGDVALTWWNSVDGLLQRPPHLL